MAPPKAYATAMMFLRKFAWAVGVGYAWSIGYICLFWISGFAGGMNLTKGLIELLLSLAGLYFIGQKLVEGNFIAACLLTHLLIGGAVTHVLAQSPSPGGL